MIGTSAGTVLVIINIVFASLSWIGAGALTRLLLHRSWRVKSVVLDAAIAAITALVAAYLLATIEAARGTWGSVVGPMLAFAAASAVLRNLAGPRSHPKAFRG